MKKRILMSIGVLLCLYAAAGVCVAAGAKEQAAELYRKGDISYQQGRYQEAEEYFQKALELLQQDNSAALSGLSPAAPAAVPAARPQEAEGAQRRPVKEYIIGVDDVLAISVWQNPDLDQEVIVRPDGMISFPLVGDVPAEGMTITQFDAELTRLLGEFVRSPEVSISIRKLGGKKVIILGEVKSPGVHSVAGANTVLEAIAQAGGFADTAVASSVILIRGGFEHPQAQRLNLTKALRGDPRLNVALQTEDIIFVPKKFISNVNFFLNQVLEPLSRGFYIAEQLGD